MRLFQLLRTLLPSRANKVRKVLPPISQTEPEARHGIRMQLPWFTSNQSELERLAGEMIPHMGSGYHIADNLITWGRNMSALTDRNFVKAWRANIESPSDEMIVWRRYVLACAAYHCIQLEGDFVECGAYTGTGMKTVMDYLGGTDFPTRFWGYDVFEHDDTMANHPMPEHGSDLHAKVLKKFADYPQVRIVKGLIPASFSQGMPERIAYLHIDLNQAAAEIAALDHLFDRMVPGAILILDDYEWSGYYRDQKLAEDIWFEDRRYRVMPLPTGQGLVIKR